ncbi:MAG: DUF502 domain-containing protein [Planctomycetota bacterium]|jgi:uncharacterized membrane protein
MRKIAKAVSRALRRNLGAGLLIFVPVAFTIWLVRLGWQFIDKPVRSLFAAPELVDGKLPPGVVPRVADYLQKATDGAISVLDRPGLGLLVLLAAIYIVGLLTRSFLGRLVVRLGEGIVRRLPLIGNVYTGTKQILEPILTGGGEHFRHAVVLEYPRRGIYAIGFVTSPSQGEVKDIAPDEMINIFLPTTPNPTSGFMLVVPKKDLTYLNMSVEDAVKLIISGGIVAPPGGEGTVDDRDVRVANPPAPSPAPPPAPPPAPRDTPSDTQAPAQQRKPDGAGASPKEPPDGGAA